MLLGFLREIQRTCELSIALVHHAGKKHHGRAGQSLRGSSDLHVSAAVQTCTIPVATVA